MTALVGGLAGIDMISGPGMLDFLLAQSAGEAGHRRRDDRHGPAAAARASRRRRRRWRPGSSRRPGPRAGSWSCRRRAGCSGPSSSCRRRSSTATRAGPGWTRAGWTRTGGRTSASRRSWPRTSCRRWIPRSRRPGRPRPRGRGAVRAGRRAAGGAGRAGLRALLRAPAGRRRGPLAAAFRADTAPGDAPKAASPGMLRRHGLPEAVGRCARRQHPPVSASRHRGRTGERCLQRSIGARRAPAPGPVPGNAASGAGSADGGPRHRVPCRETLRLALPQAQPAPEPDKRQQSGCPR